VNHDALDARSLSRTIALRAGRQLRDRSGNWPEIFARRALSESSLSPVTCSPHLLPAHHTRTSPSPQLSRRSHHPGRARLWRTM